MPSVMHVPSKARHLALHDLQPVGTCQHVLCAGVCMICACCLQALQHIRREDVVRGLADTKAEAAKVARSAVSALPSSELRLMLLPRITAV